MTDASAKSTWVVLLALLGAVLLWLWATGKGAAFWKSFQTALGQQPAPVSAASNSSTTIPGGVTAGAAALTAPPIYVTSSPTQSNVSPIPALNFATLTQQINAAAGGGLNTAGLSYSAQNLPTYVSTLNTPTYGGISLLSLLSGASGGSAYGGTSFAPIDMGMTGTTPSPLNALGQVTDDPYYGTAPGAPSATSQGLLLV